MSTAIKPNAMNKMASIKFFKSSVDATGKAAWRSYTPLQSLSIFSGAAPPQDSLGWLRIKKPPPVSAPVAVRYKD
jgi:hypothetical protein